MSFVTADTAMVGIVGTGYRGRRGIVVAISTGNGGRYGGSNGGTTKHIILLDGKVDYVMYSGKEGTVSGVGSSMHLAVSKDRSGDKGW
jgi:hypothetical protein